MTKQIKELITVLLVGTGALYILWGATRTRLTFGTYGDAISAPNWTSIYIGLGVVALAVLITVVVKTKKA